MPRVKLSEFRAKQLLFKTLERKYSGLSIDLSGKGYVKTVDKLREESLYVVKVDQAIKKRGKSGLVKIGRTKRQVLTDLRELRRQGFAYALVEPYIAHESEEEHYLALTRDGEEVTLNYSPKGGIDVESNASSIVQAIINDAEPIMWSGSVPIDESLTSKLYSLFKQTHMTLLEINPLVIRGEEHLPLDAAVEVDSSASFFVDNAWSEDDIREAKRQPNQTELVIEELNAKSPASLNCKVLNPNGTLFLLLSGGGASVVVADELSQRGHYHDIANYGEYSGNPSEDETYFYTKEILGLMLNSTARKKILVIAGGVANFTDVAKTFAGIIRAMREMAAEISKQKIRVFVRRGGPNQQKGLAAMSKFLDSIGVEHAVYGPDKSLAKVVAQIAKAAG